MSVSGDAMGTGVLFSWRWKNIEISKFTFILYNPAVMIIVYYLEFDITWTKTVEVLNIRKILFYSSQYIQYDDDIL